MEHKSKTQKKKEAHALQELGEKLVNVSDELLEDMELPEEMYHAITFARTLKKHGARRRQMQYIGSLMRKHDTGPVQEAVENIEQGNYRKAMAFRETEQWRDELMDGNKLLLEEILQKCPDADRQQLTQLVRSAVKERENNKPPKAHRILFRYLKKIRSETT